MISVLVLFSRLLILAQVLSVSVNNNNNRLSNRSNEVVHD